MAVRPSPDSHGGKFRDGRLGGQPAGVGKYDAKSAAAARRAPDVESSLMAVQHVLDDREAQARAAGFARAAAVDAIEALGQPVDMLRFHADARVVHGEGQLGVAPPPAYFDLSDFRRVAHAITA